MNTIPAHSLTARGKDCLAYIGRTARVEGRCAVLADIARYMDLAKSEVATLVNNLIREGALDRNGPRVRGTHRTGGLRVRPHQDIPSASY